MQVPASRVRKLNDAPWLPGADYVLYWMVATRRPRFNFALQHAVHCARTLKKPLVILEALRLRYPWASRRIHSFVMQGMAANARYFAGTTALYHPYLETRRGAGAGLLEALAARAALVVTDDYPCFFLPRMTQAAAHQLRVRVDAVDSNGVLPLALAEGKSFYNAYHFRRFVQRHVARELEQAPREEPLRRANLPPLTALPRAVVQRWPAASERALSEIERTMTKLGVGSDVPAVTGSEGGYRAAGRRLAAFVEARLGRYGRERQHPDAQVASGLSAHLHFGHLGVHEVLAALRGPEHWDGRPRGLERSGGRSGFWGLSEGAEAFLEEVVTFRELAFNTAATLPEFDRYASLPAWAQKTLEAHASDPRPHVYSLAELEQGATHDRLWNAAQAQLRTEGRIQNQLRMLWGKQIVRFTKEPRHALDIMIELNNKYALDGRDPNSYAGMFWVLGRYDRPWPPERPIFGLVRSLTSDAALRKLRLKNYLAQHAGAKSALAEEAFAKNLCDEE